MVSDGMTAGINDALSEHFTLREFACKDGSVTPPYVLENLRLLAAQLEALRAKVGRPVHVTDNGGYRTPDHNRRVGGAKNSQHVFGRAADVRVDELSPSDLADAIESLIAEGAMIEGGLGVYRTWVHYDTRGSRARWRA